MKLLIELIIYIVFCTIVEYTGFILTKHPELGWMLSIVFWVGVIWYNNKED